MDLEQINDLARELKAEDEKLPLLDKETALRVRAYFVNDRMHVSRRELEWIDRLLRRYCGVKQ